MKLLNNNYACHICISWTIWVEVISWACTNPNHLRAGKLHLRTDVPPSFRRFSLGSSGLAMVRNEPTCRGSVPVQGRRSWPLHAFRRAVWLRPVGGRGEGVLLPSGCASGAKGSCWSFLEGHGRRGRHQPWGRWGSGADRGGLAAEARGQGLYNCFSSKTLRRNLRIILVWIWMELRCLKFKFVRFLKLISLDP